MVDSLSYWFDMLIKVMPIFISVCAIYFTWKSIQLQKKHNINSVRPIANILQINLESEMSIKVVNYGTGPLLISEIAFFWGENDKNVVLEDLQNIPSIEWHIYQEYRDKVIPPNGEITLIRILNPTFKERRIVEKVFQNFEIGVSYKDIYDNKFTYMKSCEFYGKNFV